MHPREATGAPFPCIHAPPEVVWPHSMEHIYDMMNLGIFVVTYHILHAYLPSYAFEVPARLLGPFAKKGSWAAHTSFWNLKTRSADRTTLLLLSRFLIFLARSPGPRPRILPRDKKLITTLCHPRTDGNPPRLAVLCVSRICFLVPFSFPPSPLPPSALDRGPAHALSDGDHQTSRPYPIRGHVSPG